MNGSFKTNVLIDFCRVPPVPGDELWTEDGYVFFRTPGKKERMIGTLEKAEESPCSKLEVLGSGDGYRLPVRVHPEGASISS